MFKLKIYPFEVSSALILPWFLSCLGIIY